MPWVLSVVDVASGNAEMFGPFYTDRVHDYQRRIEAALARQGVDTDSVSVEVGWMTPASNMRIAAIVEEVR